MTPDLAYALDGSGLPVWPFSHELLGLIGWNLPIVLAGTWILRRAAPVVAAHLPPMGPLAVRDYGAIGAARHRWWVTAYCGLPGAASHLMLDRLGNTLPVLGIALDVAGVAFMIVFTVYIGRRRLLRTWYGDAPAQHRRPVRFWSVAGAVTLPAAAVVPFLPAAHLPHTTGVRLLCAVAAGLLAASVAASMGARACHAC